MLRLHAIGTSDRKIGRTVGAARSTVQDASIRRAKAAGLSWPLSPEMTDAVLEERLFARCGAKVGLRRRPSRTRRPWCENWLTILHEEYLADYPDGYGYSRFCDLMREFERRLTRRCAGAHFTGNRSLWRPQGFDLRSRDQPRLRQD